MSRLHGWRPRPKFTCGLNVTQTQWDKIFGKKLSGGDQQRDMNLLQKPAPAVQSSLTNKKLRSKRSS